MPRSTFSSQLEWLFFRIFLCNELYSFHFSLPSSWPSINKLQIKSNKQSKLHVVGLSKVMSLWSDCECTFLSSETQIQLYTSDCCVCVSSCTQPEFWLCSMFIFKLSQLFLEIQVWLLIPLWGLILWEEMTPFLFFVCSLPKLFLSVFPPLFSHLICSSFCWTLLCPSPFLPYSLQLLHPQPHFFPANTVSSSSSFFISYPHATCHMPRFIAPLGVQVHNIVTNSVSDGGQKLRSGTCWRQSVLKWFTC